LFSEDELLFFERALVKSGELGGPMDYAAIQRMFSTAARDMNRVGWKSGQQYGVSMTYVRDFVNSRPALKALKKSTIAPPRATSDVSSPTEAAQGKSRTMTRTHNFKSSLEAMKPGDCLRLLPLEELQGGATPASLDNTGEGVYLLKNSGESAERPHEVVLLDDADTKLAEHYVLPAISTAELSAGDAAARALEARQAATERAEAKRAAVEVVSHTWHEEQAMLAAELGLNSNDWERIVNLLSKPPPKLEGRHLVMNSVSIGDAIVVDAAIERAISESLSESVAFAKARVTELDAEKRKSNEKGLDRETWGGKDSTDRTPELERSKVEAETKAAALLEKKRAAASSQAYKHLENVQQVCKKLLSGQAEGDAANLDIGDLLALITWKGGKRSCELKQAKCTFSKSTCEEVAAHNSRQQRQN
ncbi:MAG: hypothetical protein SGPRY_005901, partial [Prymnesium sp.]